MADLLGSILSSMEKPPTVGDQESRRKARGIISTNLLLVTLRILNTRTWPDQRKYTNSRARAQCHPPSPPFCRKSRNRRRVSAQSNLSLVNGFLLAIKTLPTDSGVHLRALCKLLVQACLLS